MFSKKNRFYLLFCLISLQVFSLSICYVSSTWAKEPTDRLHPFLQKNFYFTFDENEQITSIQVKKLRGAHLSFSQFSNFLSDLLIFWRGQQQMMVFQNDQQKRESLRSILRGEDQLGQEALLSEEFDIDANRYENWALDGLEEVDLEDDVCLLQSHDFKDLLTALDDYLEIKVQAEIDSLELESHQDGIMLLRGPSIQGINLGAPVVAQLDHPTYFYRRRVVKTLTQYAKSFILQRFPAGRMTSVALSLVGMAVGQWEEVKWFQQNMLLHALEQIPRKDLGMSDMEIRSTFSSIYESRIAWYAFWESQAAKKNWQAFGPKKFYSTLQANRNVIYRFEESYQSIDQRLNFAFYEVTAKEGQKQIVNGHNSRFKFSRIPSLSYDEKYPQKVKIQRVLWQVAELGVQFLPLPNFINTQVKSFIRSAYGPQQQTEGALFAYYQLKSQQDCADDLACEKEVQMARSHLERINHRWMNAYKEFGL